jgi:hypothetical protein
MLYILSAMMHFIGMVDLSWYLRYRGFVEINSVRHGAEATQRRLGAGTISHGNCKVLALVARPSLIISGMVRLERAFIDMTMEIRHQRFWLNDKSVLKWNPNGLSLWRLSQLCSQLSSTYASSTALCSYDAGQVYRSRRSRASSSEG